MNAEQLVEEFVEFKYGTGQGLRSLVRNRRMKPGKWALEKYGKEAARMIAQAMPEEYKKGAWLRTDGGEIEHRGWIFSVYPLLAALPSRDPLVGFCNSWHPQAVLHIVGGKVKPGRDARFPLLRCLPVKFAYHREWYIGINHTHGKRLNRKAVLRILDTVIAGENRR